MTRDRPAATGNPRELLMDASRIPSLPEIYARINEAVNNPNRSITDVGRIIGEDAGLTARLLQLANSAFFGFPSRIDSISRACVVIGTRELRNLALATSVMRLFRAIPPDLVDMASFWRHSVACGMVARALGEAARMSGTEHLFLGGVLHDVGRLVLYQRRPELSRDLLLRNRQSNDLLCCTEKGVLGYDHAAIASELLRFWQLPPVLQEPVSLHHDPSRADRFPAETAVLHVADIMVHALQWGSSGERFVPPLVEEAWRRVELPLPTITSIITEVADKYGEVVESLGGSG